MYSDDEARGAHRKALHRAWLVALALIAVVGLAIVVGRRVGWF